MNKGLSNPKLLPIRRSVGFAAVVLSGSIFALLTARDANRGLEFRHVYTSLAPSLLYSCVYWMWWVIATLVLWTLAEQWPTAFKPSRLTVLAHLGVSCLLGLAHLSLLQHTVGFASWYWPAWGSLINNRTFRLDSLERFGVELVIYGFISGVCALLHFRLQTQQALVQQLEIERQLTLSQLQALQTQIEPHFLFNTMNAITSLVAQKKTDQAMEVLGNLNTILRTTLQRQAPGKVPFAEELEIVESYLAIQQVRFAHRLKITIDASPEALESLVPSFLLQPIVENAIRHGIEPMEAGGSVETCVKRVGDRLWLQVRDNGSGESDLSTKGHGIGMQNIKERLAYFYPDAYEFEAQTRETGGYQVTIQIPYERPTA